VPFAATNGKVPEMPEFGTGYHTYVTGLTENDPTDWILAYGDPNWIKGQGANALYLDSHVEFVKKPIAGVNFDNIYTWQYSYTLLDSLLGNVPANLKGPYTSTDSIIVP